MGDKEQGFYMPQDKLLHPNDGIDVQMVGGFVQQKKVRVASQRACKQRPPFHAR